MAKKFAQVLGLHNLFNLVESVYDVTSVKSTVAGQIDLDSVAYIIADSTDGPTNSGSQAHPVLTYKSVKIGDMTNTTPINEGDAFIWTRGKIYSGNTLAGGGGAAIDWNVTGDNWIGAEFVSNNDGSVTVTINHRNLATGTAVSSSGTAEVNGTSASGGVDVITGFKLDTNGHVTDVTRTKIYATPVTVVKTGTAGSNGTYVADVDIDPSTQVITVSKKNDGVFADDLGTTPGYIVTTTSTKNQVQATQVGIHTQGNSTSTMSSTDSEVPTNKAVLQAIQNATVPTMEFKGTTYSLPLTSEEGDMYKLVLPDPEDPQHATTITIPIAQSADGTEKTAKNGDTIIADATGKWWLVPSGDDIEDTWRAIKIKDILGNVTNWKGSGLDTGDLGFEDTDYISIDHQGDYIKILHNQTTREDTTPSPSTTPTQISDGGTFDVITGVTSNNWGHITGATTTRFQIPAAVAPGNGPLVVDADSGTEQTLFTANQATNTESNLNIRGGDVINTEIDRTQGGTVVIDINHDELTSAQKTAVAPSDPSTAETTAAVVISGITVSDYGHVTSVSKKKIPAVNNATLTVTGNNSNKTIIIYQDSESMPSSGGSASSFTANDDTAATYHIDYTGSSDGVDWATIGIS